MFYLKDFKSILIYALALAIRNYFIIEAYNKDNEKLTQYMRKNKAVVKTLVQGA
jgi:hypothetical protein